MDTIFAISSGRPPAAIAVLRISGPEAQTVGADLTGALPAPRVATLRRVRDAGGETLDHALCLWLPRPHTATGEDTVELHLHGGVAVVAAVQRELASRTGIRIAEPGEFTRQALINGRIDLTQAAGLADLLEAETEQQRKLALSASEGRLSARIRTLLGSTASVAATLEAAIDFDDEGDVPAVVVRQVQQQLRELEGDFIDWAAQPSLERLRDGVRVVLAGAPNTGKSSLLNALAERDAAIVTPVAGTTRDIIEVRVVRNGLIYTLVDTAGIRAREEADPVEQIGIDRAEEAYQSADIIVALDRTIEGARVLTIRPKSDLPSSSDGDTFPVSVHQPETIDRLWQMIAERAQAQIPADWIALDRRQRAVIGQVVDIIRQDRASEDPVILAEMLRITGERLADLLGLSATEAMLDSLFSRFCVGK